jgi:hypothetical protein
MPLSRPRWMPPLISKGVKLVRDPGSAEKMSLYTEEPLATRKALVGFRNGVWYAEHKSAIYPGVGASPEQAFRSMLRHCPREVQRDFLAIRTI